MRTLTAAGLNGTKREMQMPIELDLDTDDEDDIDRAIDSAPERDLVDLAGILGTQSRKYSWSAN